VASPAIFPNAYDIYISFYIGNKVIRREIYINNLPRRLPAGEGIISIEFKINYDMQILSGKILLLDR